MWSKVSSAIILSVDDRVENKSMVAFMEYLGREIGEGYLWGGNFVNLKGGNLRQQSCYSKH